MARSLAGWGDIWSGIQSGVGWVADVLDGDPNDGVGWGDVLRQGADAALDVIRRGSVEQVAELLNQSMSPELRAELERAYMERRAREAAAGVPVWALVAVGGVALALLMRRR